MVIVGCLLATVAVAGNSAHDARRLIRGRGNLGKPRMPRVDRLALAPGYLICAMNARHALAATLKVPPWRSLVSRTMTTSAALATSTHSPPFAPE